MHSSLSRGLTLIETIVVVALTAFILIVLSSLIQYFYKTNAYTLQQSQAVNSARTSIEHAMTDLREASYGADGSYPVLSAATSSVTFFADTDNSGTVEKVRYYLSGTTLYRGNTPPGGDSPSYDGQTEATTLVVNNIRNGSSTPLFTYIDADGNQLVAPINIASIASVRTTVLTDVDPNRAPLVYTLSGSATLRNIHNMNTQ
ncbi:MAG: hypothetical protein NUV60_00110 [Patescibacteria group bacterium]|nr:hypothetical protein [Patescibacteria group bacterium]